ncbi:hypothetical protein [Streptomyces griseoloalbus]|uniref:Secreted protein n=1 Tax=Streptomyces griseoloalbus TaxID=67303 RepID=A0A7W8F6L9_9ACTN|nr:hypothetical protein [Streptomyces albaduncus]
MTSTRRVLPVVGIAVACTFIAPPAHADVDLGSGNEGAKVEQEGTSSGGALESRITFTGSTAGGDGGPSGSLEPVGDWTPPACWYEPRSAEEFAKYIEDMYESTVNTPGQHSYAKASAGQTREKYKDGEYENYNLEKKDEGNWWVAVRDEDRWMEPAAQVCDKQPFWVENGDAPDVENAVTPQVLAELAYNRVQLPTTEVTLAPAQTTKVNLPTWAWLDRARFRRVSVTASLEAGGVNVQATTTARPVSLKLEPGTADAETYPASGECAINDDGSIGEPYAKGKADRTPPCGLKYLRSSGDGTFELQATVTWDITWTGTGGAGGDLPDGTFGNDQAVTVQEIQAINR